ncbi:hypothetical protein BH09PSE5_BH09PSE5_31040 [soil metagenome]
MSERSIEERTRDALDRQDIRDVLVRWNRALDRGDVSMMASTYCADAYDDHGKQQYRSADEAAADYITRHVSLARRTMHTTVQEYIELDADVALCESYAITYLVTDRVPSLEAPTRLAEGIDELLVTVGIRYIDQFKRVEGNWKIARRKMILEWRTFGDSVPLGFDVSDQKIGFSRQLAYHGSRSPADPSYAMADNLGRLHER